MRNAVSAFSFLQSHWTQCGRRGGLHGWQMVSVSLAYVSPHIPHPAARRAHSTRKMPLAQRTSASHDVLHEAISSQRILLFFSSSRF